MIKYGEIENIFQKLVFNKLLMSSCVVLIALMFVVQCNAAGKEHSKVAAYESYLRVNVDASVEVVEKVVLKIGAESKNKMKDFYITVPKFRIHNDKVYKLQYDFGKGLLDRKKVDVQISEGVNNITLDISSNEALSVGEHVFIWAYKVHNYIEYGKEFDKIYFKPNDSLGFVGGAVAKQTISITLPNGVTHVNAKAGSSVYNTRVDIAGDHLTMDILQPSESKANESVAKAYAELQEIAVNFGMDKEAFSSFKKPEVIVASSEAYSRHDKLAVEVAFDKGIVEVKNIPVYDSETNLRNRVLVYMAIVATCFAIIVRKCKWSECNRSIFKFFPRKK